MISVHVLENARGCVGERIGARALVVGSFHPAHHTESANIIKIDHLHAIEREVLEIDPILAVLIAGQIKLAGRGHVRLGDPLNVTNQRDSGGSEWIGIGFQLRNEQAGAWVGLQILGVHGHAADEKNGAALVVEPIGHEGTERKARLLARDRSQGADPAQMKQRAGALGEGRLGNGGSVARGASMLSGGR